MSVIFLGKRGMFGETAMGQDMRLQAVMARDKGADGVFVYGVRTTGIYCRPSCGSRRPSPAHIRLFDLPEAAERAGFRACKRCRPNEAAAQDKQIAAVRQACAVIEACLDAELSGPPTLEELSGQVGLSRYHLQRLFTRLLGVSPKQYANARRLARLKAHLQAGGGIAGAVYAAGYGSSSRVYEHAGAELGMTPGIYAKGGKGAEIAYTIADCPLGRLLVAGTTRGVCAVYLGDDDAVLIQALRTEYPAAEIAPEVGGLGDWLGVLIAYLEGRTPHPALPLDIQGTAFQRRVWQELIAIPRGETRTYGEIARRLGCAKAARAVGHACATNPVSLIIPCHRVLGRDGSLHGYRWGLDRKQALLEREGVQI